MTFQVYHWLGLIRHQPLDSRPPRDFPPPFNSRPRSRSPPRSRSYPRSNPHSKLIIQTLPSFGQNLLLRQAHCSKKSALLCPTLGLKKENSDQVSPFVNTAEVPASPRSKPFPNPSIMPGAISMPSRWDFRATKPDIWDFGHVYLLSQDIEDGNVPDAPLGPKRNPHPLPRRRLEHGLISHRETP